MSKQEREIEKGSPNATSRVWGPQPPPRQRRWRIILFGAIVLAVGLAERAYILDLSVRWGYWSDHVTNVCWALTAERRGLLNLYPISAEEQVDIRCQIYKNGRPAIYEIPGTDLNIPIYPPLTLAIFWLQGRLLEAVAPSPMIVNTLTSRLVMAIGPILFELVLAACLMLLGRQLFSARSGYLAAAACWVFPPLAMNSGFWGQADSFIMAPAVAVIYFMLRRQWTIAGLCLGVAALLKAQAVLLGPVVLFAAAAVDEESGKVTFPLVLKRLAVLVGAALAVVFILSLPWMLAKGPAWFQRSYVRMIFEAYPLTTSRAFNFWYLDALRLDSCVTFVLDSQERVLGVTKDAWGKVLLLTAGAAIAVLCWKKYRRRPMGVVAFAALCLWSAFLWPTRVHDRYMMYCVPLVIVLAAGLRRYWPAVLGLLILGMAEHTWNLWLTPAAGQLVSRAGAEQFYVAVLENYQEQTASMPPDLRPPPPTKQDVDRVYLQRIAGAMPDYRLARQKVEFWEYLFTILSLASYGLAIWATFVPWTARPPPGQLERAGPRARPH